MRRTARSSTPSAFAASLTLMRSPTFMDEILPIPEVLCPGEARERRLRRGLRARRDPREPKRPRRAAGDRPGTPRVHRAQTRGLFELRNPGLPVQGRRRVHRARCLGARLPGRATRSRRAGVARCDLGWPSRGVYDPPRPPFDWALVPESAGIGDNAVSSEIASEPRNAPQIRTICLAPAAGRLRPHLASDARGRRFETRAHERTAAHSAARDRRRAHGVRQRS